MMKISELIAHLEKLKEEHGDLECCSYYGCNNSWKPAIPVVSKEEYWIGKEWIKGPFLKLDSFYHEAWMDED